ncbi:phosphatase 2C-domain-containing protein [Zychaea mexicana]|uniref:phosphatase 2C-domain-containing protein n=1 Tax=Zychaea mexicana TaxID=64656 RepID=UPI0022FF1F0F|nr:phosphatase 2C-domain-containing protein [Zychaea mexicana]KAI9477157.1 phosphatase 2C-domain-containing protein [Zychaea mexicana]
MEDAHTTIPEYKNTGASFFAVFDGHGGSAVAKYSGEHLHNLVFDSKFYQQGDYREALRSSFLGIDEALRKDPVYENETSGCTAVAALLTKDNVLYVSNAGDSRAIISTNGRAIALSQDHKPGNEKEIARIEKAGGHVEFGRVNGNLALSRALGDFEFKRRQDLPAEEQVVSAEPDVTEHRLIPQDEFAVIACDGIWDCMTNQQVADFIRTKIKEKVDLKTICENLMDKCLAEHSDFGGVGCDNMTVIIAAFLQGKTIDDWYQAVGDKVPEPTGVVLKEDGEPELKKPRQQQPNNEEEKNNTTASSNSKA